ncbi:MAG: phenylpropionate dioxygenase [Pigmentiphaga sp.]|nr:phenylpropionate dioxygenase [Pigmentiphaga sp.]
MSAPNDNDLIDFVYHEARMLDERRYEEWLDLYAEDAYYWMPLAPGQEDPLLHASLLYEDKLLLRVRVERLLGQRTYSQQPHSRGHRLLQRPWIDREHPESDPAAGRHIVRTSFHYVETRGDDQTLYAGWATHHLVWQDRLRIRLKRVDLVNCDAAFANIQLFP